MSDEASTIGPFVLGSLVGVGGMGQVWSGAHARTGERAAIKLVGGPIAGAPALALRSEIRAVASTDHVGIVRIYDRGELTAQEASAVDAEAGTPWFAMEWASGGALTNAPPADFDGVRELLLALLAALGHAHARGIVHRDIKPANVVRCLPGDARPGPKLADFGIARILGSGPAERLQGTPPYMAPEQFSGAWRDQGPWTDLYAVGCLGWWLLSGQPPFPFEAWPEVLRAHLTQEPPPLAARIAVPSDAEAWLLRLLEKHPRDRFACAADAAFALASLAGPTIAPVADAPIRPETASTWATMDEIPADEGWSAPREAAPVRAPPFAAGPAPVPPVAEPWRGASLALFGLRPIAFCGRVFERERLWEALRAVHGGGGPAFVRIEGAAGIGKTRLGEWLAQTAEEDGLATVLRMHHTRQGAPGDGVAGMLRRELRAEGLSREQVAGRVHGLDAWDADALADWIEPGGSRSPAEREAALIQWVRARAADRPVVVLIDDAHWGGATLAFAASLLREAAPVLLIGMVRPEAVVDRAAERAALDRLGGEVLALRPLGPDERRELIAGLIELSAGTQGRLDARTAGNPLFVVQLVAAWVERGALVPGPQGFEVASGFEEERIDLVSVWAERVDRALDEGLAADRTAIEIAAVLGQDVITSEWERACALAEVHPSPALLDRWLDARLISADRDASVGFAFSHAVVREILLRRAADRVVPLHGLCALMLADDPRPGLMRRLAAHRMAAADFSGAIEALGAARVETFDTADARTLMSMVEDGERACEALGLAPDDERVVDIDMDRLYVLGRLGRVTEAEPLADRLIAQLRAAPPGPQLGKAVRLAGWLARMRGDAGAAAMIEEALAIARAHGDRRGVCLCLGELGRLVLARGDLVAARAHFEQAHAGAADLGMRLSAADALVHLASVAERQGDTAVADDALDRAEVLFEAVHSRAGLAAMCNVRGEMRRKRGDFAGAQEAYAASLRHYPYSNTVEVFVVFTNLALCLIDAGRFAEARPHAERACREFEAHQRGPLAGLVHGLLALLDAEAGDAAGAGDHLARVEALKPPVDADLSRALDRVATMLHATAPVIAAQARTLADRHREAPGG